MSVMASFGSFMKTSGGSAIASGTGDVLSSLIVGDKAYSAAPKQYERKSMAGGALSGALTGLAAGAAGGPIGMAVGAGVGLLTGILGAKHKNDALEAKEAAELSAMANRRASGNQLQYEPDSYAQDKFGIYGTALTMAS